MFEIIVNGIGHAFLQEFGCPCDRCSAHRARACTSVSIVERSEDDGPMGWHGLVDVGPGVVNAICEHVRPARLDLLLLTHWHPDHVLDINRLCESARRHLGMARIPVWCTEATAEKVKARHSFEYKHRLDPETAAASGVPGTRVPTVTRLPVGLTVTPYVVSHSSADNAAAGVYGGVSFLVHHRGAKALLLWDVDADNDWILRLPADSPLRGIRYLFVDCNTWRPHTTGHASFEDAKRYASALQPEQTLLVHLSGHEDSSGPGWGWPDWRWEAEARVVWAAERLPGIVRVPRIGERLPL
jgi:phosphoribosyl 1,2-cyclic phosphodiesterase